MHQRRKETIEEIWIKVNKNRKLTKPEIMVIEINIIQSYIIVTGGSTFCYLAARETEKSNNLKELLNTKV